MIESLNYFKDPNFKFNPEEHSYTYYENNKPVQIFEPVSGFIGQFKKPFDPSISKYVAKSRGVSQEQILKEWEQAKIEGTELGSYVHEWIEDYYNGKNPSMPIIEKEQDPFYIHIENDQPTFEEKAKDRIDKFLKINETKLNIMSPVLQEFRIFSRKWGIAGTLDVLFNLNSNTLKYYVGDWKTNKDFKTDDHPKGKRQRMLYPFDDLWDNDLNGYSLQISTYRLMLEEETGFKTDGGFLIWLGPEEPKLYKTLDLRDRIKEFLIKNNYGN